MRPSTCNRIIFPPSLAHPAQPKPTRGRYSRLKPMPFANYSGQQFYDAYRVEKSTFLQIEQLLIQNNTGMDNKNGPGRKGLDLRTKLLMTLYYLGNGCSQKVLSDVHGYAQSTTCRVLREMIKKISELSRDWIRLSNLEERKESMASFKSIANFPDVWGLMDGTHILVKTKLRDKERYINRKGWLQKNINLHQLLNMCKVNHPCPECIGWRIYASNRIAARISGCVTRVASDLPQAQRQELDQKIPGTQRIALVNQLRKWFIEEVDESTIGYWYLESINADNLQPLMRQSLYYHLEFAVTYQLVKVIGEPFYWPWSLMDHLVPALNRMEQLGPFGQVAFTPTFIATEVAEEHINSARPWFAVNERKRIGVPFHFFSDPWSPF